MGRLGFVGRIMLILMCALFALVLLTIGLSRWQRSNDAEIAPRTPLLDKAAAIVDWLGRAPDGDRPTILRAVSGANLRVAIEPELPSEDGDLSRAPRLERRLRALLRAPSDALSVFVARRGQNSAVMSRGREGRVLRVVSRLPSGEVVVIDALGRRTALSLRLLGVPPGFWVGILGFAVAGLALLAALREARPLRALTRAVARFDGAAPTEPVPERGAPDIRRLIAAVNGMQERIASLLHERSFMIGAISHDLKTYLTRLRLRSEAIEDDDRRERMVRDLDEMTHLIDLSLAFARGTTVSSLRVSVDVADLAATEAAERAALGAPVMIREDSGEPIVVKGDPVALRRVVANVIDNAIKFGRSAIEVSVERGNAHARLVVDDDGPGIADQDQAAIFSPYYRAEGSRSRETAGAGLGLAIARQIVEAHGGLIEARQAPAGGARMVITLPLAAQS